VEKVEKVSRNSFESSESVTYVNQLSKLGKNATQKVLDALEEIADYWLSLIFWEGLDSAIYQQARAQLLSYMKQRAEKIGCCVIYSSPLVSSSIISILEPLGIPRDAFPPEHYETVLKINFETGEVGAFKYTPTKNMARPIHMD